MIFCARFQNGLKIEKLIQNLSYFPKESVRLFTYVIYPYY